MSTLTPRQIKLRETILLLERLVMKYKVWIDQLYEAMGADISAAEEPDLSVWVEAFEGEEKG